MIEIAVANSSYAMPFAALHARCFSDAWSENAFRQLMEVPNTLALFACTGSGEVIGFILVRSAADECEILSLAVDAEHRRQTVGSKLVEAAARDVHGRGARAMFLEVDVNNAAATHLYRKLGFKEVGRRTGYYRICDSLSDALVLRCELPIHAWELANDSSSVRAEREWLLPDDAN
ncbi:MAG TPA: ribosomal protein S18-alanine N-acetyltransferase [Rhizomicrobium sp.]|nr:ribosomal protein S18-alanine N-acetyltransferase [Rhizomicrobium sp.]